MTEAARSDEHIDAKSAAGLIELFDGRAKQLRVIGYFTLISIVILICCAIAAFILADTLTSSEVDLIDSQQAKIAKEQGDIISEITPKLLSIRENADRFDAIIDERGLSIFKKIEDFNYERDVGKYNYYGRVHYNAFSSGEALKAMLDTILLKDKSHDVTVIELYINPTQLSADKKDVAIAHYRWGLKVADIDNINNAISVADIQKLTGLEKLDEQVGKQSANIQELKYLQQEEFDYDQSHHIQEGDKNASDNYLHQLNLNRFGPITLITIIIGILTQFYKYNMRLSAFYSARGDALRLQPTQKSMGFIRLATVLTPSIDFSRAEYLSLMSELLKH